jgi:hypothetical protein
LTFRILAAVDEFIADVISENMLEGLAAARARGRKGGRPTKLSTQHVAAARRMLDEGEQVTAGAAFFKVSRPTLYRGAGVRAGCDGGHSSHGGGDVIEYEAKILDVDPLDVEQRVLAAGGHPSVRRLMRHYVYDVVPGDTSQWLRLRDTGAEITLTHKRIRHGGNDGTDEVEVTVRGFETTNTLLGVLGFQP